MIAAGSWQSQETRISLTTSVVCCAAALTCSQIINETLPALQQLKQQGLVRFIGITGLPFKSLTYVLDRVPPGEKTNSLSAHCTAHCCTGAGALLSICSCFSMPKPA